MVFQNRMDLLNFFKQQQSALDILRDFMILKSIIVIEHDDLFLGDAIFANEPDLAMFWYEKEGIKIVSYENLNNNIKMKVSKGVFYSFNHWNIFT